MIKCKNKGLKLLRKFVIFSSSDELDKIISKDLLVCNTNRIKDGFAAIKKKESTA